MSNKNGLDSKMLPKLCQILLLLPTITTLAIATIDDGYTEEPVLASMLWTESGGFKLVTGELTASENTVARANYTNAVNSTGWAYLEIDTEEKFPDHIQVGDS